MPPRDRVCPTCGAQPGFVCHDENGRRLGIPHPSRHRLLEVMLGDGQHLPPDLARMFAVRYEHVTYVGADGQPRDAVMRVQVGQELAVVASCTSREAAEAAKRLLES